MKPRSDVVVRSRFDHEATKIVLLPEGPARMHAASAWCDEHGSSVVMMSLDLAIELRSVRRHATHVGEVIAIATSTHELLRGILGGVKEAAAAAGRADSVDALLPVLVLWPLRASPELFRGALEDWSRKRMEVQGPCGPEAQIAAFVLRQWPELAYAITNALRTASARQHTCGSTHGGTCTETLDARLSLTRMLERREKHALDSVALESAPIEAVLADDAARSAACKLAARGDLPRGMLDAAAAAITNAPPSLRVQGLRLLLASEHHQEDAVRMMASAYGTADPMNILWTSDNSLDGACTGRGWARRTLRQKLLPFTAALWRHDNLFRWHPLWKLLATDDDAGVWERVRECVAELLLKQVLSTESPPEVRAASLAALDVLHPGGDGSFAKALGKIDRESELGRRASAAQRRWKKEKAIADGELAVEEAWSTYWATLDARAREAGA